MFTGLVEEAGTVVALQETPFGMRFTVDAPLVSQDVKPGDSIAVNGCCLTVVEWENSHLGFDLLAETMQRTNLLTLARGAVVNLERAMRMEDRFGGHFVSGHIDTTGTILVWEPSGKDWVLEVGVEPEFQRYVVHKGSLAVDGISLTVGEMISEGCRFWIIPHTRAVTALHQRRVGDRVNLEFDLLAKYTEKILASRAVT